MLYLDLDNFKAYNDAYKFAKGDEIIRILTQVLKQITSEFERLAHTHYSKED